MIISTSNANRYILSLGYEKTVISYFVTYKYHAYFKVKSKNKTKNLIYLWMHLKNSFMLVRYRPKKNVSLLEYDKIRNSIKVRNKYAEQSALAQCQFHLCL